MLRTEAISFSYFPANREIAQAGPGVKPLFLTLTISHGNPLMTPGFSLKTKKYLRCHPVDSQLVYIYFKKIGQSKLSVRERRAFIRFSKREKKFSQKE
jgi:hypothetical protein